MPKDMSHLFQKKEASVAIESPVVKDNKSLDINDLHLLLQNFSSSEKSKQ